MTSRAVTLGGFAVLAALVVVMEVLARTSWRGRLCTLGEALHAAMRRPAVRLLVIAGWLWLGWHLFVRVDRP